MVFPMPKNLVLQVAGPTPAVYPYSYDPKEIVVVDEAGKPIDISAAGGRFVYCSNRGHDSIAIFSVDSKAGMLTSVGWTPTQGRQPRFIALDPSQRFLYAANEQGDTIVTFRVDLATGRLTPTGQVVRNATPVTIVFTARS